MIWYYFLIILYLPAWPSYPSIYISAESAYMNMREKEVYTINKQILYIYIYIYNGSLLLCNLLLPLQLHSHRNYLRHKRLLLFRSPITSASVAPGCARQTEAKSCPSGKTTRRLGRQTFSLRAIRLWASHARSDLSKLKHRTSSPVRPENVSRTSFSSRTGSSCSTRSLPCNVGQT